MLSEHHTEGIVMALHKHGLISARERELADAQGRPMERPYYADEPRGEKVVPISSIGKPSREK